MIISDHDLVGSDRPARVQPGGDPDHLPGSSGTVMCCADLERLPGRPDLGGAAPRRRVRGLREQAGGATGSRPYGWVFPSRPASRPPPGPPFASRIVMPMRPTSFSRLAFVKSAMTCREPRRSTRTSGDGTDASAPQEKPRVFCPAGVCRGPGGVLWSGRCVPWSGRVCCGPGGVCRAVGGLFCARRAPNTFETQHFRSGLAERADIPVHSSTLAGRSTRQRSTSSHPDRLIMF